MWDLAEQPRRAYPLAETLTAFDIVFTPDSRLLIVAKDRGIDVHDWAAGRLVRRLPLPGRANQIALHPDSRHLATVNGNGTVSVLRIPELAEHLNHP